MQINVDASTIQFLWSIEHQPEMPKDLAPDHSLVLDALDFVFDVEDGFFKVLDVGVFIL